MKIACPKMAIRHSIGHMIFIISPSPDRMQSVGIPETAHGTSIEQLCGVMDEMHVISQGVGPMQPWTMVYTTPLLSSTFNDPSV